MPQISVIVPVYNVEPYLRRCVDSILKQTFRDYELILVDDGSPDNCGAICDEYASHYDHITAIHKTNGGLASARNAGMRIAKGSYLLFCDSDDFVSEDWVDSFVPYMKEEINSFVFGGFQIVNNSKKSIKSTYSIRNDYDISEFFQLQGEGRIGFACNVLFNKEIVDDNNTMFSERVIVEDLPFVLDYLKNVDMLTYTGVNAYFYYQDDRETLSRKYYKDGFEKYREKYDASFVFISQVMGETERQKATKTLSNNYLFYFLNSLDNTFDQRNTDNTIRKILFNEKKVKTWEFQHCLQFADLRNENPMMIRLLKQKNYYLYWLIQRLARFKAKLWRK